LGASELIPPRIQLNSKEEADKAARDFTASIDKQNSLSDFKQLMKMNGPEAPTAVHGPFRISYHLDEKSSVIADYLEKEIISHYLCHETMCDRRRLRYKLCSHL
jgi:hypothetical protein